MCILGVIYNMAQREQASGFTFPQKGNVIRGTSRTGRNINAPFRVLKGVDTQIQFSIQEQNGQATKLYNKSINAILVKTKTNDIVFDKKLRIENYDLGIASLVIGSMDTSTKDAGYYDLVLTITDENSNISPVYVNSTFKMDYSVEIIENYIDTAPNLFESTNFVLNNGIGYSDKYIGSSQVSNTFGNATVAFYGTNFVGKIGVEATLAISPNESDWFPLDLTLVTPQKEYDGFTGVDAFVFEGKFNWVRFTVETVTGTIDKVLYIV